jgi:hypothetical protein
MLCKPVFVKDYPALLRNYAEVNAEAFASLREPPLRFGIHKFGHPADFALGINAGEDALGLG